MQVLTNVYALEIALNFNPSHNSIVRKDMLGSLSFQSIMLPESSKCIIYVVVGFITYLNESSMLDRNRNNNKRLSLLQHKCYKIEPY